MKVQILSLIFLIASSSAADFTCPEQFDPQNPTFFPHPDCTKYYVCDWQSLVAQSCPPGLHWNVQANYCDYPSQAGCVGEPEVTPSTPTSTPTTGKPASGKCPEEYNPNEVPTYLPHESDCTKYYVCSWGGQTVEQDCPAGLHWSQVDRNCEHPEEAGCSAVGVPSVPEGECPEVYDPSHQVYFPHGADCTKYYICTYEGTKLEQSCPAGLHWSEVNNYCDHPDRAQCKIATGSSSTSASTEEVTTEEVTAEEATTQETPVQCPFSEDPEDVPVFLPHESDCTKYYVCEHGSPTQLQCPAGLFWNAVETTCDNPEHSGCVQRVLLRRLRVRQEDH